MGHLGLKFVWNFLSMDLIFLIYSRINLPGSVYGRLRLGPAPWWGLSCPPYKHTAASLCPCPLLCVIFLHCTYWLLTHYIFYFPHLFSTCRYWSVNFTRTWIFVLFPGAAKQTCSRKPWHSMSTASKFVLVFRSHSFRKVVHMRGWILGLGQESGIFPEPPLMISVCQLAVVTDSLRLSVCWGQCETSQGSSWKVCTCSVRLTG